VSRWSRFLYQGIRGGKPSTPILLLQGLPCADQSFLSLFQWTENFLLSKNTPSMRIQERDPHIRLSATTRSHQAMFSVSICWKLVRRITYRKTFCISVLVWYDVDDAVGPTRRRALVKLAFACYFFAVKQIQTLLVSLYDTSMITKMNFAHVVTETRKRNKQIYSKCRDYYANVFYLAVHDDLINTIVLHQVALVRVRLLMPSSAEPGVLRPVEGTVSIFIQKRTKNSKDIYQSWNSRHWSLQSQSRRICWWAVLVVEVLLVVVQVVVGDV